MSATGEPEIVFVHTVPVPATGSRSLSPESEPPSRSFSRSLSSEAHAPAYGSDEDVDSSTASRAGTPPMTHFHEFRDSEDSVTCQWENCGIVYTHLPTLIQHIHSVHIGVHKSNYTCEWASCQRRGLAQTSRFALISHIRSHTGEKPFTCARPECDKSFTRSDALAKHMRLQHNISPPLPGRGGSRKRKRSSEDAADSQAPRTPPPPPVPTGPQPSSFSTFKVEPNPPLETEDPAAVASTTSVLDARDFEVELTPQQLEHQQRNPRLSPISAGMRTPPRVAEPDEDEDALVSVETLPAHLRARYVPGENHVMGRSPAMVMYLLMKAKHRYAAQQHEQLQDELRAIRAELKREKDDKELALDRLLRGYFGSVSCSLISCWRDSSSRCRAQAEHLIQPVPLPPSMLSVVAPIPVTNNSTASLNATHMSNGHYRIRPEA
ncbi:hypothetical protein C8R46DRAFT_1319387 [Mycena filopes]|nr:hypothetical protein C8R46DRAFT_1319387 [Mycena filopes]